MTAPAPGPRGPGGAAFATLLAIALVMGANHVAARVAFNDGLDVATAVACRSLATALVVGLLVRASGSSIGFPFTLGASLNARQRRMLPLVGLLIGVQSLCLYAAVARLPVALALLAFNTFPLWAAAADAVLYRRRPPRATLLAMPVILAGLALALDVFGAASGLGASGQWQQIGTGVAFAGVAAATFGVALVLTQHELVALDGRVRTACTLGLVGALALGAIALQGGPTWPASWSGWVGLGALTVLYGGGFTVMFTVLPRLGVAGHSPIMNVEPVCALVLAWWVLGQAIAPVQVLGAAIVVAAVMALGLRPKGR
ncbi:MAG: DMT family transporter [Rubrivivax sp.]